MKPYKGTITNVRKREIPEEHRIGFPPNLGYLYYCDFLEHPVFRGRDGYGGHTSLVVKESACNEMGDREIETLNSRYTIIKE